MHKTTYLLEGYNCECTHFRHKDCLGNRINRVRMALIDDETRRVVARETVDFLFFTDDTALDWMEQFIAARQQQGVLF